MPSCTKSAGQRSFNEAAAIRPRIGWYMADCGCAVAVGASMRPRPFGRGSALLDRRQDGVAHASMRPRPFGRGSTRPGNIWSPRKRSFNEAAAIRPRIGRFLPIFFRRLQVASMRPRPFGRGSHDRHVRQQGPRARFNEAAAIRPRIGQIAELLFGRLAASMRPRPFGRGSPPWSDIH